MAACLAGLLVIQAAPAAAQDQEKGPERAGGEGGALESRLLEALTHPSQYPGDHQDPRDVAPWILDKPRLAEEANEKRSGLWQAGNPHLPAGTPLSRLKLDPARSRVDLEALRAERMRVIERRGAPGGPSPPALARREPQREATRPAEAPSPLSGNGSSGWAVLGGLVILLLGAAALWSLR